jgi:signal transduction histidine kinase
VAFIRTLFAENRDIILFVYGLVFFVLGLAIALQSRRNSRLDLARSLSWLAAFGFIHGFHEWGDLFIPLQGLYLNDAAVQLLSVVQLILLAVSFACLFEFGVTLLRPFGRLRWLHGVSAGLLVVWAFVIFFVLLPFSPTVITWHHVANALARYVIGFPAGLLAAYGLREQALRYIAPLNVPHIVRMLRVAGIALAAYAIFGGLIAPPVAFFPGNWLNTETFTQFAGMPPLLFRSLLGLILAITIIRALEIFEVESQRRLEAMEQQQMVSAERDRLARELHDGAIQTVYTAGLLVESAYKLSAATPENPLTPRLERAVAALNDAIHDLRRNLRELQPARCEEPLPAALRRVAQDPHFSSLVTIRLTLELPDDEAFSPIRANHVLAILHEALSNVARHARATRVHLTACHVADRLRLTVQDNGVGLALSAPPGYGLRNMRDRARLLGGRLEIASANGKGTCVTLDVPWRDER